MKNRAILISISFIFLICFITFTFFVKDDVFNQLDFDTTVRLQDNLPKKYDNFCLFQPNWQLRNTGWSSIFYCPL